MLSERTLAPTLDQFEAWISNHEENQVVGHTWDYVFNPYTRYLKEMYPMYRPVLLPERTLMVTKSYNLSMPNKSWVKRFVFLTGPSEGSHELTREDILDTIEYLRTYE